MSAGNDHPTDGAARDGASDTGRGRIRGGRVARLVPVALLTAALTSIVVLLVVLDDDGVTREAVARTSHVAPPAAAGVSIRLRTSKTVLGHVQLPQVEVTIGSRAKLMSAPRSFLGLSTEYWALPLFERQMALFERVLSLLHVQGDGPFVLRIGGDSADHAFWGQRLSSVPPWVFLLTPTWLQRTSLLMHGGGVQLILDLNLVTGSPLTAAHWAQAAETDLPQRSIAGFEIGNEPDLYSRPYWLAVTSRTRLGAGPLPTRLWAARYTRDFQSYAHVLADVAPGVPLIGPAVAHPGLDTSWISSLIAGAHRALGVVSAHRYPFSACVGRGSSSYPTITRLLSEKASAGMADTLGLAVRVAHRAGLPFRLTELNSVTCGGRRGVSDTFATALWALDTLFELLRHGVDGANVHVRADAINAAFALTRNGLTARPLLYGLILFARTWGPNPQLVDFRPRAISSLPLKVWAVRVAGNGLHVLLIDKGNRPVRVLLGLPATGPATVQRLLAPAARSRFGVTLAGQSLGPGGSWQGQPVSQTITPFFQTITPGFLKYELTIPRMSAALVDVHLRPGALGFDTSLQRP